jgi:hypothetical protein
MSAFRTAWQGALAAQQQAIFGYGLLGPYLPGSDQPRALAVQTTHEATRDSIVATMVALGIAPVSAAADYPALYPVTNSVQALALAARLEDDCATAWRVLYLAAAVTTADATQAKLPDAPARRREAQAGLTSAAVAAARWRKIDGVVPASRPFPGI